MPEEVSPYNAPLSQSVTPNTARLTILKKIGVLKAGIVSAVTYAVMGLIFALIYAPIIIIAAAFGGEGAAVMGGMEGMSTAIMIGMGIGMLIFIPLMYGMMGFVVGVIGAAVYNLIANRVGGLEFTLEDAGARL